MVFEMDLLDKHLFEGFDVREYIFDTHLDRLLDVDFSGDEEILQGSKIKDPDRDLSKPFKAQIGDLARLHWLAVSRKVVTVLELGVGNSTLIFDDAMRRNSSLEMEMDLNQFKQEEFFTCHSVDNNDKWISEVRDNNELEKVIFHKSEVIMGSFCDRVCTYYDPLPNVSPDLIYVDGPDQFSAIGNVRGVSTARSDRMPMAADILAIEHFLAPGALIVVDGRAANARFLKANLQRTWSYYFSTEADQHYFELLETPLGAYNQAQLRFSLGQPFFERVNLINKWQILPS